MKLRTFILLSVISFGIFAMINYLSAKLPASPSQQAEAGKQVWQQQNCVSCHTLFGNGGYVGEDLTHITVKMNPSEFVDYLVNPPVMWPNNYKRHPALAREDANFLLQYLDFLNNIPTLGWPPQSEKAGTGS